MELRADTTLTRRENQIAGLAFCGLAKKEMADRLGTGTSKLNELGAWWANRAFALNIDFAQLQKSIIALSLLLILILQITIDHSDDARRGRRTRIRRYRIEEVSEYEYYF